MKLDKILNLSAFTLLCTSSIMAMMGENMTAGIGVTIGNTIQEQTFMDNYADSDLGNGPLVGVAMGSNFVMSNTGSATSIIDFRNTYYPEAKTNTVGIGFNYKMKGTSAENGFYGAFDYTNYDDMDFMQFALGHETNISGYQSNLNFYIPVGGDQTYDHTFGSTMVGTYGVDWTLSKQIGMVDLGASIGYHWNSDIKDDITAFSFGGEYTFGKNLLTTGAAYQYRDGLDSSDYGYKAYAKIPLHKGLLSSSMGMTGKGDAKMYQPIKRMLGSLIQAKELDCSDASLESYAYRGISGCVSTNPFSNDGTGFTGNAGAFIKKAFGLKKGLANNLAESNGTKVATHTTFKEGILHTITQNTHYAAGVTMHGGTNVFLKDGKSMIINATNGGAITNIGGVDSAGAATKVRANIISGGQLGNIADGAEGKMLRRFANKVFTRDSRSVSSTSGLGQGQRVEGVDSSRTGLVFYQKSGGQFNETRTPTTGQPTLVNDIIEQNRRGEHNTFTGDQNNIVDAILGSNITMTAATSATANDGKIEISGSYMPETIGGGTEDHTLGTVVDRVNLVGLAPTVIGANVVMKNSVVHGSRGGTMMNNISSRIAIKNTAFLADENTTTGINVAFGGNVQADGNMFDFSKSNFKGVSMAKMSSGLHKNQRTAVADATNTISAPAIGLTNNMAKAGKNGLVGVNVTQANGVTGIGYAVGFIGNTMDLRNYEPEALDKGAGIYSPADNGYIGVFNLKAGDKTAFSQVGKNTETRADAANGSLAHYVSDNIAVPNAFATAATDTTKSLASVMQDSFGMSMSNAFRANAQDVTPIALSGATGGMAASSFVANLVTAKSSDLVNTGLTPIHQLAAAATAPGATGTMAAHALGVNPAFPAAAINSGNASYENSANKFKSANLHIAGNVSTLMNGIVDVASATVTEYTDTDAGTNDTLKNRNGTIKAFGGNRTADLGQLATTYGIVGQTGNLRDAKTGAADTNAVTNPAWATWFTQSNILDDATLKSYIKGSIVKAASSADKTTTTNVDTDAT